MKNILRVAEGLHVGPLKEAIEKNESLFKEITARQDTPGSYHEDTETIFLRWALDPSPLAAFTDILAVDYPALTKLPEAKILIQQVDELLDAEELGRVLIVRFKPGGMIKPHIDEGAYADHFERFHLVLSSEPGNHFMVEEKESAGEFVHMQPNGTLYWFNHKKTHSVVNFSNKPRLHMIIDAKVPKYRRERDQ